ncbi:MAG: Nucleoside-diphosphate-sugar [Geobacteraceae bacterium]|nr:MAG: Nucleoside-diphosphate-sugar [Geobacteraceae bacterium]
MNIITDHFNIAKAVVTGAGGFIGKALVKYLVESGTHVIAVDRLAIEDQDCEYVAADISTKGVLDKLIDDNTVVFHLAARANVAESVSDPRGDFESTLCGHFEVLESIRKAGSQLIFPSTASIFDSSNTLPLSEKAYVKPTSPYAAAKAAGEAYCAAYHRSYGLDIKIARMFSVYGIGMNRFAIHDLIKKIQQNSHELSILGDGNQIRDYLNIKDTVRGLVMIALKGEAGEDYNLASGVAVKMIDLARHIATLMGFPDIKIIPTGKSFPGDVPKWYADTSKINRIGFTPQISLTDGLINTISWLSQG